MQVGEGPLRKDCRGKSRGKGAGADQLRDAQLLAVALQRELCAATQTREGGRQRVGPHLRAHAPSKISINNHAHNVRTLRPCRHARNARGQHHQACTEAG